MPQGEVTGGTLLDHVGALGGLAWQARDGFILVTAAPPAEEERACHERIYPVSDLLYALRDFPGPALDRAVKDSPLAGAVFAVGTNPEGWITEDFLTSLIPYSTGGVEGWSSNENASITVVNNMLVISQTAAVHDDIATLLQGLRERPRRLQVRTEARVVAVSEALLERLRGGASLEAEAEAALGRALAEKEATLLAAGELVCADSQRVHGVLMDTATLPPAKEKPPEGEAPADVRTGFVLDVAPVVGGEKGKVTMDLRTRLLRPAAGGVELEHSQVQTTLTLSSGRTVIAGSFGSFAGEERKDPRRAVLLLKATVVGME